MDVDIVMRLVREAHRVALRFPSSRWYVFGSWSRGEAEFDDIDLLIVYPEGINSQELRGELKGLLFSMPVDLYLLQEAEEREFNFVAAQQCKQIFP
jgi:predicted nucleotidyltransferase